jgi:hypothetical protein
VKDLTRVNADKAKVRAARDKLADELKTSYPDVVKQLAELFRNIEAADKECARVGLPGVELTARGIPNFMANDIKLLEWVRLPVLVVGHGTVIAWPPAKKPLGLQLVAAPAF